MNSNDILRVFAIPRTVVSTGPLRVQLTPFIQDERPVRSGAALMKSMFSLVQPCFGAAAGVCASSLPIEVCRLSRRFRKRQNRAAAVASLAKSRAQLPNTGVIGPGSLTEKNSRFQVVLWSGSLGNCELRRNTLSRLERRTSLPSAQARISHVSARQLFRSTVSQRSDVT